jgi:hypothetical protein
MPAFEIIPGNTFAFVNIETYSPLPTAGIKRISYKDNLTRGDVYGTGSVQIGLTRGKYKASGEIEVYLKAAILAGWLGPAIRMAPRPIVITYGPNGDGMMNVDTLPVCFIGDIDGDQNEGDEAITRKFSLIIPQQILWNGAPTIVETFTAIAVA